MAEKKSDLAAQLLADVRKTARSQPKRKKARGRQDGPSYSGAKSDDRDPIDLTAGLSRFVSERGWESQTKVASVVGRWPQIVGVDLSSHVVPDTFDEESGRLVLKAESTAWATQVRLLTPQLLAALDAEVGQGIVRQIDVSGPAAPARGYGQLRVPGRGPRDTYG